jgi:hypothetical protein
VASHFGDGAVAKVAKSVMEEFRLRAESSGLEGGVHQTGTDVNRRVLKDQPVQAVLAGPLECCHMSACRVEDSCHLIVASELH